MTTHRRDGMGVWVRRAASALAVATVVATAGCDSVDERVEKHYARAVALLADNDADRAAIELRNALKLNDNHVPSRLAIARLYEQRGEMRAATSNYRLVAELSASDVESRLKLTQIYLLGGALEEAAAMAAAAEALAPDNPDVLAAAASVAYRQGDLPGARETARRAVAIDASNVIANALLITDQMTAGDRAGGLAEIDRLLAEAPSDLTLNMLKLRFLSGDDASPDLGAHLQRMTEIFPERNEFREALVSWRLRRGDIDGAERAVRAMADAAHGDAQAALRLARFLLDARSADAARAELAARAAASTDAKYRYSINVALADLDFASGQRDEARALMREIIAAEGEGALGVEARVRLARYEFAAQRRDVAATLVEQALAIDADNVDALMIRAELHIADDKPEEAILDLRRALGLDPENARLMMLEAQAQDRAGNPTLAGERLAAAARVSNFSTETALAYARFLAAQNQLDRAETVLTEGAQRNPRDRALLAALAEARLRLQDWDGAEEVARSLARLDDGQVAADRVRAASLGGQGRFDESIELLQPLADGSDARQGAVAQLVIAYLRAGETDKAEILVDEMIAADPGNVINHMLRAELLLRRGDVAGADAVLQDVLTAHPESPVGHMALARLRLAQGRVDEAEQVLRGAIGTARPDGELRLTLGGLLERRGDYDGAIAEYAALHEANPDALVAANNYASLLAEVYPDDPQRLEMAGRISQRLRASTTPEFQDTFGWIAFLRGDTDNALRFLIPAAEALPANPYVQYHLGAVYAAVGRVAEARTHLEAALTTDPNFSKAEDARARLAALPASP